MKPHNSRLFICPISNPSTAPFPPPKGFRGRIFSSNNCRLFGLNQAIIAYFKIVCRNVSFCAPCSIPKHRISPKEARIDPGMWVQGPHTRVPEKQDYSSSAGTFMTISPSGDVSRATCSALEIGTGPRGMSFSSAESR